MEQFTVVLNSANATNVVQNGTTYPVNDCTYTINWASIIPEKYRNNLFMLRFTFHSVRSSVAVQSLIINAPNLGLNNRDQGNQLILGCCYPTTSISGTSQVLFAGVSDNIPITCGYPRNTQIRIFFTQISDGATPGFSLTNYVLSLNFIPII